MLSEIGGTEAAARLAYKRFVEAGLCQPPPNPLDRAHLSRAFELDSEFRALVDREPDFDPICSDPDFQAILGLGV